MSEHQHRPCFGVGVVTDAPHPELSEATQILTATIHYLAQIAGSSQPLLDLTPYLASATHYTQVLSTRRVLHLAVLQGAGPAWLPSEHLALFALTSRFWRNGRPLVIRAADLIVAEFLRRTQWERDQVTIERVQHTRRERYFAYQVIIRERAGLAARAAGMAH